MFGFGRESGPSPESLTHELEEVNNKIARLLDHYQGSREGTSEGGTSEDRLMLERFRKRKAEIESQLGVEDHEKAA